MKSAFMILLSIATFALSLPAAADAVRIATIGAFPPFNMLNKNGEPAGFDIDLVKALCHHMKVECEIKTASDEKIIQGLVDMEYDAVIATLFTIPANVEGIDHTERYYSSYLRFMGSKDGGLSITPAGLAGKKLGAQSGTASAGYLHDNFSQTATINLFETREAALNALKEGELDAVLANVHAGYNWLAQADSMGYDYLGDAIDSHDKTAIVIRKGDVVNQERFNQALQAVLSNGTYQRINRNYFPFSIY